MVYLKIFKIKKHEQIREIIKRGVGNQRKIDEMLKFIGDDEINKFLGYESFS